MESAAPLMTPAELAALTARTDRIDHILKALLAFECCQDFSDLDRAERDLLQAAQPLPIPPPGPQPPAPPGTLPPLP